MKPKTIKIFCLLLCLALLSACSRGGDDVQTTKDSSAGTVKVQQVVLNLPYSQTDTLDPYRAVSAINISLSTLIYDGLFRLDENLEAQPVLARSYAVNGDSVKVTLNTTGVFTNGSAVTAEDVVYSFDKAKKSKVYSARLDNFKSAVAAGTSVSFALKKTDIFAASCLDFPVVKSGTVDNYSGKEKDLAKLSVPLGTGRYIPEGSAAEMKLVANPLHNSGMPIIQTIDLIDIPDSASFTHSVDLGNTDFAFHDLSTGELSRTNTSCIEVTMNNLVFISFNTKNILLAEPAVRRAIGILADRTVISSQAFQGHATPAVVPANPNWFLLDKLTFETSAAAEVGSAIELLKVVGFNSTAQGVRSRGNDKLSFSLAVCNENSFKTETAQLLKTQLGQAGIAVNVVGLSWEDYEKAYSDESYDMYLGEVKLCGDMNLSAFFRSGDADMGIDSSSEVAAAYDSMRAGEMSCADFCAAFTKEMPFVPLCMRNGVASFTRSIKTEIKCTPSDPFYNISDWKF